MAIISDDLFFFIFLGGGLKTKIITKQTNKQILLLEIIGDFSKVFELKETQFITRSWFQLF